MFELFTVQPFFTTLVHSRCTKPFMNYSHQLTVEFHFHFHFKYARCPVGRQQSCWSKRMQAENMIIILACVSPTRLTNKEPVQAQTHR